MRLRRYNFFMRNCYFFKKKCSLNEKTLNFFLTLPLKLTTIF